MRLLAETARNLNKYSKPDIKISSHIEPPDAYHKDFSGVVHRVEHNDNNPHNGNIFKKFIDHQTEHGDLIHDNDTTHIIQTHPDTHDDVSKRNKKYKKLLSPEEIDAHGYTPTAGSKDNKKRHITSNTYDGDGNVNGVSRHAKLNDVSVSLSSNTNRNEYNNHDYEMYHDAGDKHNHKNKHILKNLHDELEKTYLKKGHKIIHTHGTEDIRNYHRAKHLGYTDTGVSDDGGYKFHKHIKYIN